MIVRLRVHRSTLTLSGRVCARVGAGVGNERPSNHLSEPINYPAKLTERRGQDLAAPRLVSPRSVFGRPLRRRGPNIINRPPPPPRQTPRMHKTAARASPAGRQRELSISLTILVGRGNSATKLGPNSTASGQRRAPSGQVKVEMMQVASRRLSWRRAARLDLADEPDGFTYIYAHNASSARLGFLFFSLGASSSSASSSSSVCASLFVRPLCRGQHEDEAASDKRARLTSPELSLSGRFELLSALDPIKLPRFRRRRRLRGPQRRLARICFSLAGSLISSRARSRHSHLASSSARAPPMTEASKVAVGAIKWKALECRRRRLAWERSQLAERFLEKCTARPNPITSCSRSFHLMEPDY